MKRLIASLLLVLGVCHAQTVEVSPNLVYTTINPAPEGVNYTWSGFTVTDSTGQGFSGGNVPGYNSATGTFMFGYTPSTVAYTYAFSQALQNSGMSILGYNYSWEYLNQGFSRGTLLAAVNFTATNGLSLHNRTWTLGQTGATWETVTGTETFANGLLASTIANFGLSFTGQDDRFWAGYYGPQVRNPSISLNYTFDACAMNPLSSPTCAGYEAAFLTQQCTVSALYSPSCPGYAVAYLEQQCAANPLYSTTCVGYNEAYAKKNILDKKDNNTIVLAQADTTSVPLVSDPVVNKTITSQSTTANAEANPAAPVKLTAPTGSNVATQNAAQDTTQNKKSDTTTNATDNSSSNNKTKTTREALVEKQREKARAEAVTKGKELANTMGKAADMAAQVEVQNVVIQAMGFTPGFDSYARILPDGQFYRPYEAYPNQRNVDTPAGRGLFGGSDNVHQQMVDQQYNLGK